MAERNALGPLMGLRDSEAIRHTLQFRYLRDSRERHIRQKTGGCLFAKERNRTNIAQLMRNTACYIEVNDEIDISSR